MPRRAVSEGFGEHLRAVRLRAGLTLTALSVRSGVSLSSLSRFESGTSQPGFADVCAIARSTGTPLLFLADGRDRTGNDPRDLIAHLAYRGLSDIASGEASLIGEARPFEGLVAQSIGTATTPRILEGIPALLLKNDFSVDELEAEATATRTLHRLGWLAEIAEWIATQVSVALIHPAASSKLRQVRSAAWKRRLTEIEDVDPSRWSGAWDLLDVLYVGDRTQSDIAARMKKVPPIARKWQIAYDTPQEAFLARAHDILAMAGRGS